jgi:hypothetical protein
MLKVVAGIESYRRRRRAHVSREQQAVSESDTMQTSGKE